MRRTFVGMMAVILLLLSLVAYTVQGASGYANPAFQTQWQAGEAITPNFWGPITTAHDGQQEPYQQAQGGMRLVQYFDKGRMELTNGVVTNGLLASEIVKGQVQVGDATFQPRTPPAIPIAGDPDNPSPTYAQLGTTAASLLAAASSTPGAAALPSIGADGTVTAASVNANGRAVIGGYDDTTKHNVPGVFVDYRNKAGLLTIGLAISEPFAATVKVAGKPHLVEVQVFERRVLTYTPDNEAAFQVEMGNIGAHYYTWRYTGAPVASGTTTTPPTTTTDTAVLQAALNPPSANPPPFATVPHNPVSLPANLPPLGNSAYSPPTNLTCASFHSQAAAQEWLRVFPNDPDHLDPGKTGIACPNNPAPTDMTPVARS